MSDAITKNLPRMTVQKTVRVEDGRIAVQIESDAGHDESHMLLFVSDEESCHYWTGRRFSVVMENI
jgi:hypothetical protein